VTDKYCDKIQEERTEDIPEDEVTLVEDFLEHFIYGGTSAKKGD
jgi:hypothetical protein